MKRGKKMNLFQQEQEYNDKKNYMGIKFDFFCLLFMIMILMMRK